VGEFTRHGTIKGGNMNRIFCSALLILAVASAPASAQGKTDANTRKTFKGYALHELGAAGLLYEPKAKAIYYKALGTLSRESWLANLDGPSSENKPVKVAGADYVLVSTCENRNCDQNSVVLLWSGAQDMVYGKVYQRGKSTLIGSPPPAVAAELEKLWKAEHRRGR
jgi:Inhibitor of vertebrate lysozyme (Ivy)